MFHYCVSSSSLVCEPGGLTSRFYDSSPELFQRECPAGFGNGTQELPFVAVRVEERLVGPEEKTYRHLKQKNPLFLRNAQGMTMSDSGRGSRKVCPSEPGSVLEPGAVGETVGHDDVLVEVVGARGAVIFHLVDHLADGEDGGRGAGLHL